MLCGWRSLYLWRNWYGNCQVVWATCSSEWHCKLQGTLQYVSHRIQEIQAVQRNTQQNHFHSSPPREWRTEASPWLYKMSKSCKNCSWYPVTADNPQQPCGAWYTDERCCCWAGAPSRLSCQPINCHGGAEEWRVWEQCGRVQLQQRTWH